MFFYADKKINIHFYTRLIKWNLLLLKITMLNIDKYIINKMIKIIIKIWGNLQNPT